MSDTILLPWVDDDGEPFWEGARQGELRMQRCASCGRFRFPPRPMCPWCHSLQSEWPAVSGRGTIWSFVVSHPPLLPYYAALAPYNVIVVELDEDPTLRIVGNLVAGPGEPINSVDPSTIEIGQRVQVVFDQVSDELTFPRWVRA